MPREAPGIRPAPTRRRGPDPLPPLTADERGELRALLLKARNERQQQLIELGRRPPGGGAVRLAYEQTVRTILQDVETALERLEPGRQGAYGRCESCDDRLPYDVLRRMPWERSCDDCLVD